MYKLIQDDATISHDGKYVITWNGCEYKLYDSMFALVGTSFDPEYTDITELLSVHHIYDVDHCKYVALLPCDLSDCSSDPDSTSDIIEEFYFKCLSHKESSIKCTLGMGCKCIWTIPDTVHDLFMLAESHKEVALMKTRCVHAICCLSKMVPLDVIGIIIMIACTLFRETHHYIEIAD